MKGLAIIGVALCLACVVVSVKINEQDEVQQRITQVLQSSEDSERIAQFRQYVVQFNRHYGSDHEVKYRFEAFKKNMDLHDHFVRNEEGSAVYGMTEFTDKMDGELTRTMGRCMKKETNLSPREEGLYQDLVQTGNEVLSKVQSVKAPASVDWRAKGFVGPVLDQGYCSSSWAYAATTALETAYAIKNNNTFVRLSKQQLIDCDPYNDGCCGGLPHYSYLYLARTDGIELDKTYNGRQFVQRCHYKRENAKVKVHGLAIFSNVSVSANEQLMEKYVANHGPIAVNLTPRGLSNYVKGIIRQADVTCVKKSDLLAFSVTLVGYGEEGGIKYWIAKNSWGKKWGEKGYFRIERGQNMCGLAFYGVAPIIK